MQAKTISADVATHQFTNKTHQSNHRLICDLACKFRKVRICYGTVSPKIKAHLSNPLLHDTLSGVYAVTELHLMHPQFAR